MSTNTVRKETAPIGSNLDTRSASIVDEFDRFFGEQARNEFSPKSPAPAARPAVREVPTNLAPVSAPAASAAHVAQPSPPAMPPAAVSAPVNSPASASHTPYQDPLMAELARIVGQGGSAPGATVVSGQTAAKPVDPLAAFEEELRRFDQVHRTASGSVAAENTYVSTDQGRVEPHFDAQAVPAFPHVPHDDLRGAQVDPAVAVAAGYPVTGPAEPDYQQDVPDLMPPPVAVAKPRSRKVVMLLSGAAVIAVAGIVGAVAMKGGKRLSGEPPLIAAKNAPMKERPADPGGVEIPGQDRQVLAKGATDAPRGTANVVNKEEQPVDLNQTPKREVSRVILPSPAGSTSNGTAPAAPILMPPQASAQPSQPAAQPPQSAPVVAGGFEAKRVRSVRVGSEGQSSVPVSQPTAQVAAPSPSPSAQIAAAPPPTSLRPATTPAAAPKAATPVAATPPAPKSESRPATAARSTQSTTPAPVRTASRAATPAESATDDAATDGPISLRPPSGASPTRQVAKTTAAPAATPTTTASTGRSGTFAVQLAAAPSEADARAAAASLRKKYSALSGHTPTWRTSEVKGRTVYRVRVGNLSRESANELCGKIKSGGGSCFVASN